VSVSLGCLTSKCSKDTVRTFVIYNLRNRFSSKDFSKEQITVTTQDDDEYTFDASTLTISATQLPPILTMATSGYMISIVRSNSVVSSLTDITLKFTIQVRLAKTSLIQIFIPK